MIVKLLTEHHLEFLSSKGGCRGSSESKHVKLLHCTGSYILYLPKVHAKYVLPLHIKVRNKMDGIDFTQETQKSLFVVLLMLILNIRVRIFQ